MGEYGTYAGRDVKMGTCEDMYYLRADQARSVRPKPGSLNPSDPDIQRVIRFRFPWPDEDHIEPGAFEAHDRSTFADVEPIIVAIRARADQERTRYPHPDEARAAWWHAIADRIAAGYQVAA